MMTYFNIYPQTVTKEIEGHYYRYDDYENARCSAYKVVKKTLHGVWISLGYGEKDKFILDHARRRWAYPTMKDALNSFRIRKERQIMHSNASIDNAIQALIAVGLKPINRNSRFRKYDDEEVW
jgi:hypothetical protein